VSAGRPSTVAAPRSSTVVDRVGHFVFSYRDYLVPAGLVAVLALTRPHAPFGSERLDLALDVLGWLVAAAGQVLRIAVIGFAYIQRGGVNKQMSAPHLVCEGFYAHSRNPMYVGDFLLFVGLSLIYNSAFVYLVVLPVVAMVLLAMVQAEESYLRGRFGAEYAAYCQRVNRFIPRLRGLRDTTSGMHFDWRRVLRKEYGTAFAWISVAFALLAWQRIVGLGWSGAAPGLRWLCVAYLPIPLAYGIVRWLKKTDRLCSPDYVTPRAMP
jgi:protein-S-isoprenylcysteine O-methyltransferase Ste14